MHVVYLWYSLETNWWWLLWCNIWLPIGGKAIKVLPSMCSTDGWKEILICTNGSVLYTNFQLGSIKGLRCEYPSATFTNQVESHSYSSCQPSFCSCSDVVLSRPQPLLSRRRVWVHQPVFLNADCQTSWTRHLLTMVTSPPSRAPQDKWQLHESEWRVKGKPVQLDNLASKNAVLGVMWRLGGESRHGSQCTCMGKEVWDETRHQMAD